ncbi:non-specific lipid transfer protein GPI-anchored 7-like [Miscanthus floridulus]|uniref:non-specific lipid transfer protein GPI-anchored 7-like n=1 Tax=Miscanthus floridulus TaxID=154761 RepID=UPI00345A08C3
MHSCTEHTMQQSAALLLAAVGVACLALAPSAYAQGTSGSGSGAMPSCAAKLVPCAGYLNSTSTAAPVAACCGPLRDAAANETACLCSMLLNRAALRAFGVAPEQGLVLARRCNVTTDASACAAGGASSGGSTAASSASTGSASSSVTKPTANGGSVARRLSMTGASSLVGFSFIWWTDHGVGVSAMAPAIFFSLVDSYL